MGNHAMDVEGVYLIVAKAEHNHNGEDLIPNAVDFPVTCFLFPPIMLIIGFVLYVGR